MHLKLYWTAVCNGYTVPQGLLEHVASLRTLDRSRCRSTSRPRVCRDNIMCAGSVQHSFNPGKKNIYLDHLQESYGFHATKWSIDHMKIVQARESVCPVWRITTTVRGFTLGDLLDKPCAWSHVSSLLPRIHAFILIGQSVKHSHFSAI